MFHLANEAEGHRLLFSRIRALRPKQRTLLASAAHELRYRAAKRGVSRNLIVELGRVLSTFTVLPFDRAAALAAVKVRVELERVGKPIGIMDTLQAGHALALGAVMVTDDTAHFGRVPGLAIENWRRAA